MKKSPFAKYVIWSTLAFLVFICFLMRSNLLNLVSATFQLNHQKKSIEWYEKDIDRLDREIRDIRQNKDSLEKFARENFYFASDGDDVYIVPED